METTKIGATAGSLVSTVVNTLLASSSVIVGVWLGMKLYDYDKKHWTKA